MPGFLETQAVLQAVIEEERETLRSIRQELTSKPETSLVCRGWLRLPSEKQDGICVVILYGTNLTPSLKALGTDRHGRTNLYFCCRRINNTTTIWMP